MSSIFPSVRKNFSCSANSGEVRVSLELISCNGRAEMSGLVTVMEGGRGESDNAHEG